ncbi:flagellar basal body P-ring formation chaperone FlgA [Halomonas sp. E19]|uniref:flagellar basal body P-ring formation chaperone FlgA n=1 Tax=Halomonas sp. E19 TaxID=3397247 RepID=UPI004033923B
MLRRRPRPVAARRPAAALLALALFACLPPAGALADDAALLDVVQRFLHQQAKPLGEEIIIEVRPTSAVMPACEFPQPFLTREGEPALGRVSVGVRCGSDGRQVRYLQAEVGVIGDYPVLATSLAAGDSVQPHHLESRRGNLAALPSRTLLDSAEIVGQVLTRPLGAGQTLQAHHLRALPLVERNQRVVVEAHGSGFRIAREGQALEPGGMGDRVRVRFDSREMVTARVIGQGLLAVDF